MTCDDSFYSFFLSHKCAYGASLVAFATGKRKYREMSARVARYIYIPPVLPNSGGQLRPWSPPPTPHSPGTLDQTAEIGTWLKEIGLAIVRADSI